MPRLAHKTATGLLFCPDCGSLLDLPGAEDAVKCDQCGHLEPVSSYENIEITTRSHPDAFPSALRDKRKTQTKEHRDAVTSVKVAEKCPKCGYHEALSNEVQLRSADEGSTIFYTCLNPHCRNGWRVNN